MLPIPFAAAAAAAPQNEAPSVLGNAACWSFQMGVSSNLRYQMLGGADTVRVQGLGV